MAKQIVRASGEANLPNVLLGTISEELSKMAMLFLNLDQYFASQIKCGNDLLLSKGLFNYLGLHAPKS